MSDFKVGDKVVVTSYWGDTARKASYFTAREFYVVNHDGSVTDDEGCANWFPGEQCEVHTFEHYVTPATDLELVVETPTADKALEWLKAKVIGGGVTNRVYDSAYRTMLREVYGLAVGTRVETVMVAEHREVAALVPVST